MTTKELIDAQMAKFNEDLTEDRLETLLAKMSADALGVAPAAKETPIWEPTPLDGFPSIYAGQPPPFGAQWLAGYEKAKSHAESGGIMLFYGSRGTGKSRMAYEVAKNANLPKRMFPASTRTSLVKPRPALYRSAMMVFMELRDTFHKGSEFSELQVMRSYSDAALLVIDEVQERGETGFEDRKITAIVDSRYSHGRPTILIGNYTRQQFAESMSASIVDRIRENGGGINFEWECYRKQPQPTNQ